MVYMLTRIISIEVDMLLDWVLRNDGTQKLFRGIQDVICKTICREMTLYAAPRGTIVCHQGDFGDIFYIILSGHVALFVNERQTRLEEAPSCVHRDDDDDDALHGNNHKAYGTFIRYIRAGGTFGELAVMDPTAQRYRYIDSIDDHT